MKKKASRFSSLFKYASATLMVVLAIVCLHQYAGVPADKRSGKHLNRPDHGDCAAPTAASNAVPGLSQTDAGVPFDKGAGNEFDPDQYLKDFEEYEDIRQRAEEGHADAQLQLGGMYVTGKGVPQDYAKAAEWYQKAADQTNAWAQIRLGRLYGRGLGVPKDLQKAVELTRQAGDQGDAKIQNMIGWLIEYPDHFGDLGLDLAEAAYWHHEAAQQGHVESQEHLGIMYFFGKGVQRDFVEAARWLQEPAKQGAMKAQRLLGTMYEEGQGVDKNLVEAARWYRKAADQGDEKAQIFLGSMYCFGDGVDKDMVEAAHWLRKAAEQGSALAQGCLGEMYYKGQGVVKNPKQAYIWLLIASARGHTDVEELIEQCESDPFLTANDIREAREIAAKWQPSSFSPDEFDGELEPVDEAAPVPDSRAERVPSEKLRATGSGFVISADGYFLTCAHVIEGAGMVKVRIGDKVHPAGIVRADSNNDVALLKIEGTGFSPLPLGRSLPEMGDKVFTVGFPNLVIQGSAPKYTDGAISSLTGILDDIRTMQITVPTQGGNSGGALADANGTAIGLVVSQLNAINVFEYTGTIPQNVNFAVKIAYAQPLIQAVPGLSNRLPRPAKARANSVKAVEAATGLVIVYE